MRALWKRYLLKELFKFFILFLVGFYLLYTLIDYSIHIQDFVAKKHLSPLLIGKYYLMMLIKRIDILMPLAFLLGTLKVFLHLNKHKELLALQSSGVSIFKIVRPFLVTALFLACTTLAIFEYISPYSLNFIDYFHDAHLRHSYRGNRSSSLNMIQLDDQSKLIYQNYQGAKDAFFDVIWIRNFDDIWKMRYLKADPHQPIGEWVDHITRREDGALEKIESFDQYLFSDLSWNKQIPRKGYIPFENRSISELFTLLFSKDLFPSQQSQVLSHLLFKLSFPFFPLMILFAISPFCLTYARHTFDFAIYGLSVFGFVAFVAFIDAGVILGESNTLSPYFAILIPFSVLLAFSTYHWMKWAK